MRAIERIRRSGVGIRPDRPIAEAAQIMERSGVGTLAVLDGDRLVGVVTDRDIVRRAIARGMPLDERVDAVMSTPPITIDADADLTCAFDVFRSHALRRLAVLDRAGHFVGMLSLDDLLVDLADNFSSLVRPLAAEIQLPQHDSAVPATVS
jgi:CBS domain-containing protein